jgi:hypothetical protein
MPSRSPNLTLMDFSLWGHLKECVYAVTPKTIKDLMARLQAAGTVVSDNMLRCVQENATWCTTVWPEMDGGCFEHLL